MHTPFPVCSILSLVCHNRLVEIVLAKHEELAHKIHTAFELNHEHYQWVRIVDWRLWHIQCLIRHGYMGAILPSHCCCSDKNNLHSEQRLCNQLLIWVSGIYVVIGGLRSTFICDYLHTVVSYVIVFIFMFSVYATSPHLGSPGALYDLLFKRVENGDLAGTEAAHTSLSDHERAWSLVPQSSWEGFLVPGQTRCTGKEQSPRLPHTAVKVYVLGSLAWYAVPFAMATCMGLAAAALQDSGTFPVVLTSEAVSVGLVAPAAAIVLLGKGGACLIIVLFFMAVTSSTSAESIGASSLITFDIYKGIHQPQGVDSPVIVGLGRGMVCLRYDLGRCVVYLSFCRGLTLLARCDFCVSNGWRFVSYSCHHFMGQD